MSDEEGSGEDYTKASDEEVKPKVVVLPTGDGKKKTGDSEFAGDIKVSLVHARPISSLSPEEFADFFERFTADIVGDLLSLAMQSREMSANEFEMLKRYQGLATVLAASNAHIQRILKGE